MTLFHLVFGRSNALLNRALAPSSAIQSNVVRTIPQRTFTALSAWTHKPLCMPEAIKCLQLQQIAPLPSTFARLECVPVRTVTKFSLRSGKRKTVKSAIKRFYRLHWGGWIRTRCGRHKKMHKKRPNRKHRLRQHVLVNSTQATLLDKMVTSFWKRPKHYIDDIYEPYHERTFYWASKKPMPYPENPLKSPKTFWELSKGKY